MSQENMTRGETAHALADIDEMRIAYPGEEESDGTSERSDSDESDLSDDNVVHLSKKRQKTGEGDFGRTTPFRRK
jgi:hypothetical protein